MTKSRDLVEAAIKFDEPMLSDSKDAGALHFVGVLNLDPRHTSHESDLSARLPKQIDVDESSILFMVGEVIRNVMVGKNDTADSLLADLGKSKGIERVLVLLIEAWLKPSAESLAAVHQYIRNLKLITPDLKARVYLKLMTWALDMSDGKDAAGKYYDRALQSASPLLKQAIYSVGMSFGRESRYYFAPVRDTLITYSWITQSVSDAAADLIIRNAKAQISPFTRTFGGDPHTLPQVVRAAELQAGWTGAYWVLEKIWRVKAAILLVNSRDREERAQAITSWVLGRGSDLARLMDDNENFLTEDLISRILIQDLKSGDRIASDDWVEICLPIWDELPAEISTSYITSADIKSAVLERGLPAREDSAIALFTALSRVDQVSWVERFQSLKSKQRLAVCSALTVDEATALPEDIRGEVRKRLLRYLGATERIMHDQQTLLTLAALISELPTKAPARSRFLEILPIEYSADVAFSYPDLVSNDMVREDLRRTVSTIREQVSSNQKGTWAGFARSPALAAAQCMVALEVIDEDALAAIIDFATSEFSKASDVIDSVNALSWLSDEGLLPSFAILEGRLEYRTSVSPVDRYWTGRDDLRAINAAIGGLYARNPETSRDAVARLIPAARDPDVQVRLLALDQLKSMHLLKDGLESSLDAAILGAIFDPDSRVQTRAIQGIWVIRDPLINEMAWSRLVSVWDTAHRRVRMAAAVNAARDESYEGQSAELRREIIRLASGDRSLLVRTAAAAVASRN